ncbi:hypothetical protein [Kordia sp.]|uniref:hypothetical protein n=1 Tax=Kordia sp. TaxID=1965332 RepID=UPI003D29EAF6
MQFRLSILLLFVCCQVFSQHIIKHSKVETVLIYQYEYIVLSTNNGTECICTIKNTNNSQEVIVTIIGDTQNTFFNNNSRLNGIHVLSVKEQIIAISNFKGSQIIISNFSINDAPVFIGFLCPSTFSKTPETLNLHKKN